MRAYFLKNFEDDCTLSLEKTQTLRCRPPGIFSDTTLFLLEKGSQNQLQRVCVEASPHQEILRHQQGVWEINSVLTLATQVKGSVSQDHPSLQTPVASPGCYLCFWPTGYKSEVPRTSSSGPTDLVERLTELRKTHVLTRLLIYYKRILKDTN